MTAPKYAKWCNLDFVGINAKVVAIDDTRREEGGELVEKFSAFDLARNRRDSANGCVHVKEKFTRYLVHLNDIHNIDHVDGY